MLMILSCIVATQDLGLVKAHVQSDLDAVALWPCISQLCLNVGKSNAVTY